MPIKSIIDANGNVEVIQDNGPNPTNGAPMETRWSIPVSQVQKHLPMFDAGERQLSKGERSALADVAAQYKKNRGE